MKPKPVKEKAPKNRTITLNDAEIERYQKNLLTVKGPISSVELENKTISQDVFQVFEFLQVLHIRPSRVRLKLAECGIDLAT